MITSFFFIYSTVFAACVIKAITIVLVRAHIGTSVFLCALLMVYGRV